ncbi:hypothetical protein ABZ863_25275 [Saccharomonospora sp. NPDC046836]|uniref:hypothetical protein n=1 Tax=Saccharomonospora sp. NPDC046836 TaxID=3156921 RepID=UPI003405376D
MSSADSGLRFWLRYVEAEGGLTEHRGDSALAVLPSALSARHELPEELVVTGDPDVAREDDATLLAAGNPVLERAADDVLSAGDAGRVAIEVPVTRPPNLTGLQDKARDQFAVDHGKIEATGPVTKGVRPVLRVGALVSYTVSAEDHYQERIECFLDMGCRRELPERDAAKLVVLPHAVPERPADISRVTAALGTAHRIIDSRAEQRRAALVDQVAGALDAELARAEAYYRDVLVTIDSRRANAGADRRELLDARAEATRDERARRLAEIREKYQPAHETRPYRLHVYDVPVWRVPVDVRRGDRRYSLTLEWLIPLSRFGELRCPQCDALEPLVAGKTRLGCTSCLAKSPVQPVSPPEPPATKASRPAPVQPTETIPRRVPKPRALAAAPSQVSLSPAKIVKEGEKLSGKLWDAVVNRDRRLSRLCAADSPAATVVKLYGAVGAATAIGLPDGATLVASASTTEVGRASLHTTRGVLKTATGQQYPFLLWWCLEGVTPLIEEILPFDSAIDPARLPRWSLRADSRILFGPPKPRVQIGPIGELLWSTCGKAHGLPVVLRCLAAWWRLPAERALIARHSAPALAAALQRMICYRAGRPGSRYADAAVAYLIDERRVRAASTDLQAQLRLSSTKLW